MEKLSTLVRCANCANLIRPDARQCWACSNKAPEILGNSAAMSEPPEARLERRAGENEQERNDLNKLENRIQLALAGVPWRALGDVDCDGGSVEAIEIAARMRASQDQSERTQYPQPSWLHDLVARSQPNADRFLTLILDLSFLEMLMSTPGRSKDNEQSLRDREQILVAAFEVLCQYHPSSEKSWPEAGEWKPDQAKMLCAKQLQALFREMGRLEEAEKYREAALWEPDYAAVKAKQQPRMDSSGATFYLPGPDPDDPQVWSMLGDMCYERKLPDSAMIWYRRWLDYLNDTNQGGPNEHGICFRANASGIIGRILIEEGKFAEAERLLEEALEGEKASENPSNAKYLAQAYSRMAFVQAALGKETESEENYKTAIALLEREHKGWKGKQGVPWYASWAEHYTGSLKGYVEILEKKGDQQSLAAIRQKLAELEPATAVVP